MYGMWHSYAFQCVALSIVSRQSFKYVILKQFPIKNEDPIVRHYLLVVQLSNACIKNILTLYIIFIIKTATKFLAVGRALCINKFYLPIFHKWRVYKRTFKLFEHFVVLTPEAMLVGRVQNINSCWPITYSVKTKHKININTMYLLFINNFPSRTFSESAFSSLTEKQIRLIITVFAFTVFVLLGKCAR